MFKKYFKIINNKKKNLNYTILIIKILKNDYKSFYHFVFFKTIRLCSRKNEWKNNGKIMKRNKYKFKINKLFLHVTNLFKIFFNYIKIIKFKIL